MIMMIMVTKTIEEIHITANMFCSLLVLCFSSFSTTTTPSSSCSCCCYSSSCHPCFYFPSINKSIFFGDYIISLQYIKNNRFSFCPRCHHKKIIEELKKATTTTTYPSLRHGMQSLAGRGTRRIRSRRHPPPNANDYDDDNNTLPEADDRRDTSTHARDYYSPRRKGEKQKGKARQTTQKEATRHRRRHLSNCPRSPPYNSSDHCTQAA